MPFSVPAYTAAPSAENARHVKGAGIRTDRNRLVKQGTESEHEKLY